MKNKRSRTEEQELLEAIDKLPHIDRAPMCERCIPYGRCQGLSQIGNEDWMILQYCIETENYHDGTWQGIQEKYDFLDLERIKIRVEENV